MGVYNHERRLGAGRARALRERIWEAIEDLQKAGVSHTAIIDDLLFEAGWMIEVVVSGEAIANKDDVCRLVSKFSESCAGLIDPGRRSQPGHH